MSKKIVLKNVECPLCHDVRDRFAEDVDGFDVWCPFCREWFEIGFQIHSED